MNTAFGRKFSPYDIHDAVGEKDFCTRQAVVEWPEFMMHDAVSLANWPTLLALFPEFQLTVQLGTEVIASLNSIPLAAPPVSQLDDGGWDWALETGISGKRVERPANCLCGLQIGICREMQGKGLAGMMIALMKALAQKHGFSRLIIPVRPAGKALFPLISMEEYCRRKRSGPMSTAAPRCCFPACLPCPSPVQFRSGRHGPEWIFRKAGNTVSPEHSSRLNFFWKTTRRNILNLITGSPTALQRHDIRRGHDFSARSLCCGNIDEAS